MPITPKPTRMGTMTPQPVSSRLGSLQTRSPLRSEARSSEHYQKGRGFSEDGRAATGRLTSPERRPTVMQRTGAVVIDTGTGCCKAGFAGQQSPKSVLGSWVGRPTERSFKLRGPRPDTFVGEQARTQPDVEIIEPVRNGIIIDWEAAEVLWRHMFYHDLQVRPKDHALLLSDPPLSPTTNREKMVEVVFESLNSPAMYIAYHSVLSVYAHGKISGLVVDSGYAVTHTVPVHQGYNLPHAIERMDIAGSHMTSFLMKLLNDSGHVFTERMTHIVEDIKHKCCYVAANFERECHLPRKDYAADFRLPDGHVISLGKERFQCPEMLFTPPKLPGISFVGVHNMAQRSLSKVPEEARGDMYQNIFLCGGSSLFNGLEKRFTSELLRHLPPSAKVRVSAVPLRKFSVWTGGSILASLKNFQACWIQREQYDDIGPYVVHRKCY